MSAATTAMPLSKNRRHSVMALLFFGVSLFIGVVRLHAHKLSDSYLSVRLNGADITGQWDIDVRDLEYTVGLDADGAGTGGLASGRPDPEAEV